MLILIRYDTILIRYATIRPPHSIPLKNRNLLFLAMQRATMHISMLICHKIIISTYYLCMHPGSHMIFQMWYGYIWYRILHTMHGYTHYGVTWTSIARTGIHFICLIGVLHWHTYTYVMWRQHPEFQPGICILQGKNPLLTEAIAIFEWS